MNNQEKKKEYYNNFMNKNKDKIKKIHICECGGKYSYFNKSTHKKSIKHRFYLAKLSNPEI